MKILNTINLSNPGEELKTGDFVRYEYDNGTFVERQYIPKPEITEEFLLKQKKNVERQWRNSELAATDWIVQIPDHPKKLAYTAYRKQLRDYPTQPDFPNGERPIKPE